MFGCLTEQPRASLGSAETDEETRGPRSTGRDVPGV